MILSFGKRPKTLTMSELVEQEIRKVQIQSLFFQALIRDALEVCGMMPLESKERAELAWRVLGWAVSMRIREEERGQ